MTLVKITNKQKLAQFYNRNRPLHIYEIGDLDDFFWKHTKWYGNEKEGTLVSAALVYSGSSIPTLLALSDSNDQTYQLLLNDLVAKLPHRFYCHLSLNLAPTLQGFYHLENHGIHNKMHLTNDSYLSFLDSRKLKVRRLEARDIADIATLYTQSYADNWFDARMLETGRYFGGFLGTKLVSIAGVHVYSPQYGVAALGNITTDQMHRGKGYAKFVTAHLCQDLKEHVTTIGLNVKSDNTAAIRVYEQLGFERHDCYEEYMATKT